MKITKILLSLFTLFLMISCGAGKSADTIYSSAETTGSEESSDQNTTDNIDLNSNIEVTVDDDLNTDDEENVNNTYQSSNLRKLDLDINIISDETESDDSFFILIFQNKGQFINCLYNKADAITYEISGCSLLNNEKVNWQSIALDQINNYFTSIDNIEEFTMETYKLRILFYDYQNRKFKNVKIKK